MKVEELANILRIHVETVKRLLRKGIIKSTKVKNHHGGSPRWEVSKKDLDEFLKSHEE